ncbi:glycosyltransferase family 4 protein [Acinetobacter calcoaceticus]|uniref:glycosyltransferase family 4 protein n=1 Tax=Acinetobacter calcoaceticus TaxID=471 RepID=UPI00192BCE3E|nr:glycosyltransferase family 4 protein [Acinetobacter calcoaceticus]
MRKVVHLTSVHQRYDARIYLKECLSLSKKYHTYLVVADGHGDEQIGEVNILDVGLFLGRKERVFNATKAIFQKAVTLDADIYHLHDPELILLGLKLKRLGKKVVFDAHEDFPKQILTKPYIPLFLRKIISSLANMGEKIFCSHFNGIVGATPFITEKFLKINKNVVNINNFPKIEELQIVENLHRREFGKICYIGGITVERGIIEIVDALLLTKHATKLVLAGKFHSQQLEIDIKKMDSWKNVDFVGFVDRTEIKNLLSTAQIGLVTLHPTISYLDSLPVKLFEYMCAGIPVIASDFPLWREIVEKHKCGICVDPTKPQEIANAIDYLMNNQDMAQAMGENGFKAVQTEFNWSQEEQKLFKFYEKILG